MSKLKVYISSTFRDMEDVRSHIIDIIRNKLPDFFELSKIMELMHGNPLNRPNIDDCLSEVRKADLYIILVGDRYGSFPDYYHDENDIRIENTDKLSYTELEYQIAEQTLQSKLYGIYKFRITEAFFSSNKLDKNCDLSDGDTKQKHSDFLNKLSETNVLIPINSNEELVLEIFSKLYEFNFYCNNLPVLKISDLQKAKINRHNQVNIIKEKKINNTDTNKQLGRYSRCVVMVINTIGKPDYYEGFNLRLKNVILNTDDSISIVGDLKTLMAKHSNDNDRILEDLLLSCSSAIFGEEAKFLNFDNLYSKILNHRIQNKFISIDIGVDCNEEDINKQCFKIISQFIIKLEYILSSNDFENNFYFVINLKEEDLSDNKMNAYHNQLHQLLTNIECINLNKLELVNPKDVKNWLSETILNKPMEKTVEEIYKFIFLKTEEKPGYYKDYIEQLEKRTKKWNT